jgi:hypothetical protein
VLDGLEPNSPLDASSENLNPTWDISVTGQGDWQLRVYEYNESGDSEGDSESVVRTVDNDIPDANSKSPQGAVSENQPEISAEFDGGVTGLKNASINLTEVDGVYAENTNPGNNPEIVIDSDDYDDDSLDDGEYTVDYEAYDEAGNHLDDSWTFTVDTTQPDPDNIDLEPDEGVHDVEGDDEFSIDVSFDASNDHSSRIDARCIVDGEEQNTIQLSEMSEDDSEEFTCDIDSDEFGSDVEFEFELVDQAGNEWTDSDTYTYSLDESGPEVTTLEPVQDATSFGDDFEVDYAFDDLGDIQSAEYYFSEDADEVDRNEIDDVSDDGTFTVDTTGLESGDDKNLFVRAQDEFDRWGDASDMPFKFYPDREPSLSLNTDDSVEVVAGSEKSLSVDVENTGELLVSGGSVSGSKSFVGSADYSEIEPEGTSTVDVSLTPSEDDIGSYNVTLESSTGSASTTVEVTVRATEDQKSSINQSFQDYNQTYFTLSQEVSELNNTVSQELFESLGANYSQYRSTIEDARQALDSNNYYRAQSALQELEGINETSMTALQNVKEKRSNGLPLLLIGGGLLLFILLVGGGIAALSYSDQYELDVPLDDYELETGLGGYVDVLTEKIDSAGEGGSSEDESNDGSDYSFK